MGSFCQPTNTPSGSTNAIVGLKAYFPKMKNPKVDYVYIAVLNRIDAFELVRKYNSPYD